MNTGADLSDLIHLIGRVKHFQGMSEAEMKSIILAGQVLRFRAGEVLFDEGAPCAGMFVLLQGKVHILQTGPQGRETIHAVITPVIMINEVAVIDGGVNPVSARAAEDCLTWQIGCERFQVLIERHPQIGLGLLRVLALRNRSLIMRQGSLAFYTVQMRLALLLLELSHQGGEVIDRRLHPNTQLAARAATVAEAVSRTLKQFAGEEFIEVNRRGIRVLKAEQLRQLVDTLLP